MEKSLSIKTRRYDIDWLRIGLIASVFLFHIGMFFNGFGWHIKNNEEIAWLNPIMAYLHRWRMPLLFFVSGVGTYYALGKRNIGQYIRERYNRLIIPLLVGMVFIVPPQIYVEKHAEYASFLSFIPEMFDGIYPEGNKSWHHLWFVLYLFICSVAALPVILLFRSKYKNGMVNSLKSYFSVPGSLLTLCIALFLVQLILRNYFPWETHGLFDDWAYLSYSFLFFIFGFVLFSDTGLIDQIIKQRRLNGFVAFALTGVFFFDYFYSIDPYISRNWQLLLGSLMEWSIGITVIGYGGKYLNRDSKIRRHLNEAIYPFYILHQTVIVVIGLHLFNLEISAASKALVLTLGSFFISVGIYLAIIRPFNFMRVLFGMRTKKKVHNEPFSKVKMRKAS